MKVLYVDFGSSKMLGVRQKILSQVISLRKLNVDIKLAIILEKKYDFISDMPKEYLDYISVYYYSNNKNIYHKVKSILDITGKIFKQEKPDIIYMRYPGIRFIKPLKRKLKNIILITEHQSIEIREKIMTKQWKSTIGEIIFGRNCRKYIDGFVGVTNEITNYEIKKVNNNIPHITISNGINVSSLPIRKVPNFNGKKIDLLCVANLNKWHGLDRLIRGLLKYEGSVDIILHIVGPRTNEMKNIRKLVDNNNLNNKMFFYGPLSGENYNILFNGCHIAMGVLAPHRKGLKETCALKNREYCARGIPFIYAGNDPDFQSNFPYILKFPSNEMPIEIENIINFSMKIYKNKKHNIEMRKYALKNIDWFIKMKKLKIFFEVVIENK